jgi:hypothetical protein
MAAGSTFVHVRALFGHDDSAGQPGRACVEMVVRPAIENTIISDGTFLG